MGSEMCIRDSRGSRPGSTPSLKITATKASQWSVGTCYASIDWAERGARIDAVFVRRSNDGRVAYALLDVDFAEYGLVEITLRLGVPEPNVHAEVGAMSEERALVEVPPELIVRLAREGAAFSERGGHPAAAKLKDLEKLFGSLEVRDDTPTVLWGDEEPPAAEGKSSFFSSIARRLGMGG